MKDIFKKYYLILLILIIGVFLRFYRVEANFPFTGEIGHNLLEIKNYYLSGRIPLLGPPTSHPWLYFGPIYYWVYGPLLIISGFNPLSHAYFGAFVSVLIIVANFLVVRWIVNSRVAIISSFLIAVSPLFLEFSRAGRFFSIVSLLVYPFLFFLYQLSKNDKRYIFWLGLTFGCMFSFHFTPIMLIPFAVSVIVLKRIHINKIDLIKIVAGFLVSMLPFIIYDLSKGLSMTRNVVLWIPYRIAGFVGLYPKNTVSKAVIEENVSSLYEFLTKSFVVSDESGLSMLALIVLCILVTWQVLNIRNKKKKFPFSLIFILLWFLWGYIAVFIHGSPPIHYFVPVLSAPIIIVSFFIAEAWNKKNGKFLVSLPLVIFTIVNLNYYFSINWFYIPEDKINRMPYYVPFRQQESVIKFILKDAKRNKFSLKRVGPYDSFEDDYAQNYIYLFMYHGSPISKNGKIKYVIIEEDKNNLYTNTAIFEKMNDVSVVKIQ